MGAQQAVHVLTVIDGKAVAVRALQRRLDVRLELCQLGIDARTLKRWRQWWLEQLVDSAFWRAERSRFLPRLCEQSLPLGLCEQFQAQQQKGLLKLLKFLTPLSSQTAGTQAYVMD